MGGMVRWNKNILVNIEDDVKRRMIKVGLALEADVKRSFTAGGVGGNPPRRQEQALGTVYRIGSKYKSKKAKAWAKFYGVDIGKYHVASAPGQPPAVDTGRLRASITTNWKGSGLGRAPVKNQVKTSKSTDTVGEPSGDKFKVVVGTNVEYAPYLEFGTRKMEARPFLTPAYERIKSQFSKFLSRYTSE